METSLDRKLARCAREIEEAKPKGMSFAEFETGDHVEVPDAAMPFFGFDLVEERDCRQIKGAAQASPKSASASQEQALTAAPVAAPPSRSVPEAAQPKFKVGDRVRHTSSFDPRLHVDGKERVILSVEGVRVTYSHPDFPTQAALEHMLELVPPSPAQDSEGWRKPSDTTGRPLRSTTWVG